MPFPPRYTLFMLQWLRDNEALLWWLGIGSVVMFVGSLLLLPWLVAKIPADYFMPSKRPVHPLVQRHPVIRLLLAVLRNLLGVVILLAGVAMLILPGQGILAILLGLMLIDFPGKYRLEQWAIRKPSVHKPINWLRTKAKREPLQIPQDGRPVRMDG